MFNRKKKEEKEKRLLEDELDINNDVVVEEKKPSTTKKSKLKHIQPVHDEDDFDIVVTASTLPDDFPEIGPSFQPDPTIEPEPEDEIISEPIADPEPNEIDRFEEIKNDILTNGDDNELDDSHPEADPPLERKESVVLDDVVNEEEVNEIPEESLEDEVEEEQENVKELTGSGYIWTSVDDGLEPESIIEDDEILEDIIEEQITNEPVEAQLSNKSKVDLNSFFESSGKKRKLKRSERKKYSRKELKRRKKRKDKRISEDIKDQRVFKFRRKKYKEVEDFIAYLNDHYLDIDDVAHDVLADENFFGWISKRSGVFPQSLKEFKEIKAKIETND